MAVSSAKESTVALLTIILLPLLTPIVPVDVLLMGRKELLFLIVQRNESSSHRGGHLVVIRRG
jgi:hypothetical protein